MDEGIGVHPPAISGVGGIGGPHGGAGGSACGSSASSSTGAFAGAFGEPTSKCVLWTKAEDDIIIKSVAELGNKWNQITLRLPGRTASATVQRHSRLAARQAAQQAWQALLPAASSASAAATDDIDDLQFSTVTTTVAPTSHQPSAKNFQVGDLVFCRYAPTSVCRRHSVFTVVQDGLTAGDGCITGQFIIRLVRPHATCNLDPDHLMTVMVNGDNLVHVDVGRERGIANKFAARPEAQQWLADGLSSECAAEPLGFSPVGHLCREIEYHNSIGACRVNRPCWPVPRREPADIPHTCVPAPQHTTIGILVRHAA